MTEPKHGYCPCGSPQSYPIPHEHDQTDREKQIIAHYEQLNKAMYEALGTIKRTAESGGDLPYLQNALKIISRIAKETLA